MKRDENNFSQQLRIYRQAHRTVGCKLCHLIGVPLIALSLPIFIFNRRQGLIMFGTGWFFQLVGHLVFEKNRPVLTADATNIYTYLSALAFVFQEWKHILSGEPLAETRLGADAGIGIEPVDDPPEQLRKAG